MKTIYVVRHGRTYINKYHRFQGWCDAPLIEEGKDTAKKIGEALKDVKFDLAVSSDLKRAVDSRDIIVQENNNCENIKSVETPDFREYFLGYFEGMPDEIGLAKITGKKEGTYKSFADMAKDGYSWPEIRNMVKAADPTGDAENDEEFQGRIQKGIKWLENFDNVENILLVAHGVLIRYLCEKYGKGKFNPLELPTHTELSVLTIDDNGKISMQEYGKQL